MKKPECENAIRSLAHEFADHKGLPVDGNSQFSFGDFVSWLHQSGYGRYLEFSSTAGPRYDAEIWFNEELRQAWRD